MVDVDHANAQGVSMKIASRSAALYGTTLAGMLLLGACGKKESAPPATSPAAASTAAAAGEVAAPSSAPAPAAAGSIATATPASGASTAMTPKAAAAPAAAPALSVSKLTVGDAVNAEHQVTHSSSDFASNVKTIYASVATEGSSSGATLNAKWSYLEGQGQLVSSISQSIATEGPAVTTFKVQNPDLWPEGKYKVEISLDGKVVKDQAFQIKKH
jgi:hypothetical protein